jgi:hypothetical protein
VKHKLSWVKAHQDSSRPYDDLPRNAQLNVLADEQATAFPKFAKFKVLTLNVLPEPEGLFKTI